MHYICRDNIITTVRLASILCGGDLRPTLVYSCQTWPTIGHIASLTLIVWPYCACFLTERIEKVGKASPESPQHVE